MNTLNIVFKAADQTERFPLYRKYPGQFEPQKAYIFLDLESGECGADYSGEIGNAIPSRQWHNIVLTFAISPYYMADKIESVINDNAEFFQALLDNSAVEWDGNNYRGKITDEKLNERVMEWDMLCQGFDCDEGGMIEDLAEYLQCTPDLENGQTVDQLADDILSNDGDNGYYFTDSLNSVEAIKSELLDMWADGLYSGNEISKNVAQCLIAEGVCDDSQWMDELHEFADK